MDNQLAAMPPGDVLEICIATAFLVIGLSSCAIAALRRRGGVRIFLWIGIWSASYGLMHLLEVRAVEISLPARLRVTTPYVVTAILYLTLVVASLAWLELTVGIMRRIVAGLVISAAVTAALGIGWFLVTGVNTRFIFPNNMLAAGFLLLLLVTVTSKRLFKKYLLLPHRGFLVLGTVVFALNALCANVLRPLFGFQWPILLDHVGFLVLLVAFAYSGLQMVLANEHRLLEIEAELEVARQIQASILPTQVPEVRGLRISATYRPMACVAGDFYEFVPLDHEHAGFLVADVCGHGVPAALIASMLKVAVQSVAACADRPAEFLGALNRVLTDPLRGQLVSASYLWIDMVAHKASYSAAGHPPLLRCNQEIELVESNGLLFGISPGADYPVRQLSLFSGDRLLLYTDGVTEAENTAGQAFGDYQLQRVLSQNSTEKAGDISRRIMTEIQTWQRTAEPQDDITLIVIDVR
ncbi:MAG: PP2C family protein-serine/threonine phosphatase [Chlamydiota bacterium]